MSWRGQLSEKSYKYRGRFRAYGFGEGLGAELSFQRPPRLEMGTSDIAKCTTGLTSFYVLHSNRAFRVGTTVSYSRFFVILDTTE